MGVAQDVGDRVSGRTDELTQRAGDLSDRTSGAPSQMVTSMTEQTQGSPLVAGGIAFGIGLMIGGLLPASDTERRLGQQAMQAAEPVKAELQDAGRQVAEHLKEPAKQAVQDVKETAQSRAQQVRDTAQSGVQQVSDDAKGT